MSAHAILSASGSERWLHCTPSARLEATLPDQSSVYAEEGTLAHAIAELRLRKYFTVMKKSKYDSELKKLQKHELYKKEMLDHVQTYFEYVEKVMHSFDGISPYAVAEKRLDLSHIVPESFGTGDCIIIGGKELHVIDFKYGQGVVVEAERNSQMMLYALGALRAYSLLYQIERVHLTIVQPRAKGISSWETTPAELAAWGEEVKVKAQEAWEGKGVHTPGDWCRFCRARQQCRARAEHNLQLEGFTAIPTALMTPEQIAELLPRIELLMRWGKELQDYAFEEALAGRDIPGYKLVAGRSTRKFTDQDKAFAALIAAGIEEAVLYERKPLPLTKVESLLDRAEYETLLQPYITKEPGKPTLVPESDKRPPMRSSAADDFTPVAAPAASINQNEGEKTHG